MDNTIHIHGISKTYTHKKKTNHALVNIDLTIPSNRIVGLIGPNGAGKTSLLKILAGHIFPSQGSIEFTNSKIHNKNQAYQVCMVQEYEPLYTLHRVKDILEISCSHYPNWEKSYVQKLINIFQLDVSKKYSQLSKGQRGLVSIIIGLSSMAPVTVFDETHISLDIIMRQRFFDLLLEAYTDSQRTFILSTHYINEASNLFEDIIMMDKGKILLHEEKDTLDNKTWTIVGDTHKGYSLLEDQNILKATNFGQLTEFHYFGNLSENTKVALKNYDFTVNRSSLETFFLNTLLKEEQYD
jgi:ABC-2 type transport system ATP-binding protein